jgi:hypothetical protein
VFGAVCHAIAFAAALLGISGFMALTAEELWAALAFCCREVQIMICASSTVLRLSYQRPGTTSATLMCQQLHGLPAVLVQRAGALAPDTKKGTSAWSALCTVSALSQPSIRTGTNFNLKLYLYGLSRRVHGLLL